MLLIRLRAEIEAELESVVRLQDDLNECVALGDTGVILRAKASVFHDFYTGMERIFVKIASELNGGIPNTPQWHIDLLQDMCLHLEEIRPPVVSAQLRDALLPFLRFRHLFRNLYGFNLDPRRLEELSEAFPVVLAKSKIEMEAFTHWLRETSRLPEE
jgi:hypothetical protein